MTEFNKESFIGKWAIISSICDDTDNRFIGEVGKIVNADYKQYYNKETIHNMDVMIKFRYLVERAERGEKEYGLNIEREYDDVDLSWFNDLHHKYYYHEVTGNKIRFINEMQVDLNHKYRNKKFVYDQLIDDYIPNVEDDGYTYHLYKENNEMGMDISDMLVKIKNISVYSKSENQSENFEDHLWDIEVDGCTYYGISGKNLSQETLNRECREVDKYALELLDCHRIGDSLYDEVKEKLRDILSRCMNNAKTDVEKLKYYKSSVFSYLQKIFYKTYEVYPLTPYNIKDYKGLFMVNREYYDHSEEMKKIKKCIVGIVITNGKIQIKRVGGAHVEGKDLPYLIQHIKKYYHVGKIISAGRENFFYTQNYEGSSGSYDEWVVEYEKVYFSGCPEFVRIKRGANIHLSMYDKLNEGFKGSLLDFSELFCVPRVEEPFSSITVREINFDPDDVGLSNKSNLDELSQEIFK